MTAGGDAAMIADTRVATTVDMSAEATTADMLAATREIVSTTITSFALAEVSSAVVVKSAAEADSEAAAVAVSTAAVVFTADAGE